MAIRVSAITIQVGVPQTLSIARGEDRELRLAFKVAVDDPNYTPPPATPTAVNMTGATSCTLRIRAKNTEIVVLEKPYLGFHGAASAGTPRFQLLAADTVSLPAEDYDVDVDWNDGIDIEQLLVLSTLKLLDRLG